MKFMLMGFAEVCRRRGLKAVRVIIGWFAEVCRRRGQKAVRVMVGWFAEVVEGED